MEKLDNFNNPFSESHNQIVTKLLKIIILLKKYIKKLIKKILIVFFY